MLRSGVAFNTKRCAFLSGSQDLEMTRSFPGGDRPAELPPPGNGHGVVFRKHDPNRPRKA
jgi:hypothetical protein